MRGIFCRGGDIAQKNMTGSEPVILCALAAVETLVEALDTSAGIHQLLLACEERVALGADFNLNVLLCGHDLDHVAAVAGDCGLFALRMQTFLCHVIFTSFRFDE